MNIVLHFAYGNLLAKPFHIGGNNSLIIGGVFLGLFVIALLFTGICPCDESLNIFKLFCLSCKEIEDLDILDDVLSENRKLPPKIVIRAKAVHEESREVVEELKPHIEEVYVRDVIVSGQSVHTVSSRFDHANVYYEPINTYYSKWKRVDEGGGKTEGEHGNPHNKLVKNEEKKTVASYFDKTDYEYISWNDNMKVVSVNLNIPILHAYFDYKLIFNESAQRAKREIVDQFYEKGKKSRENFYHNEYYWCDDLFTNKRFYLNQESKRMIEIIHDKKFLFIEIIFFIFGYSSILECFFYEEEDSVGILIEKLISGKNDCPGKYMQKLELLPTIEYKQKDERITSIGFKFNGGLQEMRYTEQLLYKE